MFDMETVGGGPQGGKEGNIYREGDLQEGRVSRRKKYRGGKIHTEIHGSLGFTSENPPRSRPRWGKTKWGGGKKN